MSQNIHHLAVKRLNGKYSEVYIISLLCYIVMTTPNTSQVIKLCYLLQSDDAYNPEQLYDLVAVVVHCGISPNRGHYISLVKSHGLWLLFDDDTVEV